MPKSKNAPPVKLTVDLIARTALELLNEVGLDGLTMRQLAARLNVQAPALYWHVKNKQELLDAMATIMYVDTVADIEAPRRGESWQEWAAGWARRLRRTLLRYRDGARVFAGTAASDPVVFRTVELTLRTLCDAGFSLRDAARGFPAVLHYTVGFTIEEQARSGLAYDADNPYRRMGEVVDPERFPLTAAALGDLFDPDTDAGFDDGLRVVLAGLRVFGARE
ncbi:TetR/AcrR family transcriptional regulator C-terminal domain-containing protein [Nocardia sp. NPDC003482]|uniref:TetR/AcrR family transcriptional regulator C-terminal domain-containing protein n=1 Tax=Nocardia sp. NPDC004068 TaxID=3364303 RepID=UPI003685E143